MKKRTDFVSNSSSTSFILSGQDDIDEFTSCFSRNKCFIKISKLKEALIQFKESLDAAVKKYCETLNINDTDFHYLDDDLIDGVIYKKLDIDDLIREIDGVIGNSENGENLYITEPVDRDIAYDMSYTNQVWRNDL